jgi:hypothetical protein
MTNKFEISFAVFFILLYVTSCTKNYTDCECEKIASDALINSAGIGDANKVNLDGLENCGKRLIKEMNFSMDADKLSVDYINQYYYEKCRYGFYDKKGN